MAGQIKLRNFVERMTALVAEGLDESSLLVQARNAMRTLVAADDWLLPALCRPDPLHYQQYLLHCDPLDRFSAVSFVWGPGQQTPVHDHTVWGVIGMLRGAEVATSYTICPEGLLKGPSTQMRPGQVELVSPTIGDVHQVKNAYADRISISIHCYGANIGKVRRHVYDPMTGNAKEFVSGYADPDGAVVAG